jgi:hypothetical protein
LIQNKSIVSILKSSEELCELNVAPDNCTYNIRLKTSSNKEECDQKPSELTKKEEENKAEPLLPKLKGIVVELGGESSWVGVGDECRHDTCQHSWLRETQ